MSNRIRILEATGCDAWTLAYPYSLSYVVSGPVHRPSLSFKCNHCGGVNRWKLDAEPAHKCRYCGAPPT